jgi:hypothetical protein
MKNKEEKNKHGVLISDLQNCRVAKKINYEEYKQEKSCEMFYKLEYLQ